MAELEPKENKQVAVSHVTYGKTFATLGPTIAVTCRLYIIITSIIRLRRFALQSPHRSSAADPGRRELERVFLQ
jgi:hypothetical protein